MIAFKEKIMILLKNALVHDGSLNKIKKNDVLIDGDKILDVGSFSNFSGKTIDLTGFILCPGFIDLHAHSDLEILRNPLMKGKTNQGILTEISGNCGIGVFPIKNNKDFPKSLIFDILGQYPFFDWTDYNSYKDKIHSPYDMRMLTSHSALRFQAIRENANREATDEEIKQMTLLLKESFTQGTLGLSMGLYYAPGVFASNKELLSLAKTCAENNKILSVHHRCEGTNIISSLNQILSIAKQTGVKLEISHLKIIGDKNQSLIDQVLNLIENSSQVIGFDQYPFEYGSTTLMGLLPPKVLSMERIQRSAFLKDSSNYPQLINEINNPKNWDSILNMVSLSKIFITELTHFPELRGKNLIEVGEHFKINPYHALFKILSEETGEALMIDYTESSATLGKIFRHRLSAFGTDALYNSPFPHPRCYNSTNHILDPSFLKKHSSSLEWAIHRMTGLSAERFNLNDVGFIRKGLKANLVCFDPKQIKDNSSISEPAIKPEGFKYIIQNGKIL